MTSGKKIPPAVPLGMVIVNKGNNKITELRTIEPGPNFDHLKGIKVFSEQIYRHKI